MIKMCTDNVGQSDKQTETINNRKSLPVHFLTPHMSFEHISLIYEHLKKIAKSVVAYIFAKSKYVAKQTIFSEFPDHVL